ARDAERPFGVEALRDVRHQGVDERIRRTCRNWLIVEPFTCTGYEIVAHHDEARLLQHRIERQQQAVCPIGAHEPGIDTAPARNAVARPLVPMAQDTRDQSSLVEQALRCQVTLTRMKLIDELCTWSLPVG